LVEMKQAGAASLSLHGSSATRRGDRESESEMTTDAGSVGSSVY
jgi:hypothetical protein